MADEAPRSFQVEVNPRVLWWARTSSGVDLEWAAQRVGRPDEVVQAWETGKELPTFAALRQLAHLYRMPVSVLLLPQPPAEPPPPEDRRWFAGIRPRPLRYSSSLALREARQLRDLATELYEAFGLEPALAVGSIDLSTDPEEVAGEERERLGTPGIDGALRVDDYQAWWEWRRALEGLNILVLQFPTPLRELRGFALSGGPGPPVIAVSGKDRVRPRTFTLFHEYAHLLLGRASLCLPSPSGLGRSRVESFANDFAAAILVPLDALKRHPAAQALRGTDEPPPDEALRPMTGEFLVTKYVVWQRLRKAEYISPEVHEAKWRQWRAELGDWSEASGGRTTVADRAVASRGPRLVSMILQAERRGLVEYSDLPTYLGQRLSHLDEIERRASELGARG